MEIKKFLINSFSPEKSTDAQLADDFRLLAAKYAVVKEGGKTEFTGLPQIIDYTVQLLREIYKRGKMEFHPETENKTTQELLREAMPKIVSGQIITDKAQNLSDGTFKMHLTTRKFDYTAPHLLAGKDGTIYGVIRFEESKPLSLVQFDETEKEHGYTEEERKTKLGGKTKLYAYKVRDFYPFIAVKKKDQPYDEEYYAGQKNNRKNAAIEMGEVFNRLAPGNILEVGYGSGNALEILKESGCDASGLDNSEAAKKISEEKGLGNLFIGKAEAMPFPDGSFENVISFHTLEHVGNIDKAIGECVRVAKTRCLHIIPLGELADKYQKHEFINHTSVEAMFSKVAYKKNYHALNTGSVLIEINKAEPIEKQAPIGNIEIKEGDSGEGVLQTHERGLSKDQADYTEPFGLAPYELSQGEINTLKLLKAGKWQDPAWLGSEEIKKALESINRENLTVPQRKALAKVDPVSIHTDFRLHRMGPVKDDFLQGGQGFTPGNQFKENLFLSFAGGDNKDRIMGNFKTANDEIEGPLNWLTMGEKEPEIIPPGKPGSTENAYARISQIDKFKWVAGVQRKDYKEFKFEGEILKGRWIFTLSPLGDTEAWLIGRPEKQEFDSEALKENLTVAKNCSIFKIDNEKHLVYGAVYVPDEADTQGDWASADDLENAAHQFLVDLIRGGGRRSGTNLMHETSDLGTLVQIVESGTLPVNLQINGDLLPKGTWFICAKINDMALWQAIKDGEITGFSMEGDALGITKR